MGCVGVESIHHALHLSVHNQYFISEGLNLFYIEGPKVIQKKTIRFQVCVYHFPGGGGGGGYPDIFIHTQAWVIFGVQNFQKNEYFFLWGGGSEKLIFFGV